MIKGSNQFDLGLDTTRMKDSRDSSRQHKTVDAILERFFTPRREKRCEIQILADEVGMGKTFVGLAVAYSVLESMQNDCKEEDLNGCYKKVLVITPNNSALYSKWQREVSEFVNRCVVPEYREEAAKWFAPTPVKRIDQLSAALRRAGTRSRIIVANMSIFSGGRLLNYDLKRRFLLGIVFRYWGNRFQVERRERLLKGAPKNWALDPYALTELQGWEREEIPFSEDDIFAALKRIEWVDDKEGEVLANLLESCRYVSEKYMRNRKDLFREIEKQLDELYKIIASRLIAGSFPLVIVDEAHNWKNHRNGYDRFTRIIASKTRRALLLTATPFQLHPEEMLRILEVSDHMAPCPTQIDSKTGRDKLKQHREHVVRPILKKSAAASTRFTEAWMRLPLKVSSNDLAELWESQGFERAKTQLRDIAALEGVASEADVRRVIDQTLVGVDPDVRQLMREALQLYTYNADLSYEMGAMVIRHRRRTEHRLFKVGAEYKGEPRDICKRPDSHILHAATGIDVRGDGELPHYLLMRCVAEMKGFKGRASLSSTLTGCYSTLLESAEGKEVNSRLKKTPVGSVYLDLLMDMVSEDQDPHHPKIREVVDQVARVWEGGEKSLIFCFRLNTAKRLKEIIDGEIRKKLNQRRRRCLGGEEKIKFLRSRLTGKEQDLITIGLDRVIWSFILGAGIENGGSTVLDLKDLILRPEDLFELARISLRFNVDLTSKRVDRVFLNRAIEYIFAKRLLETRKLNGFWHDLFEHIADLTWVSNPYGLNPKEEVDDGGEDVANFDERGVHSRYECVQEPDDAEARSLAQELHARRDRALRQRQIPIFNTYSEGASLWLGPRPLDTVKEIFKVEEKDSPHNVTKQIHEQLCQLTVSGNGFDWESRRKILQAMRKALLRESVLLRLLPERSELEEGGWGELLAKAFLERMPGQHESMADRINVFLEDLLAASGSLSDENSARHFLYNSTRLRDQKFVALITGKSGDQERERVFAGFNTPLLPEVLICTAVGQEGIDLHRHCRHVVHYDLAWNPAVLEQRTGRADRIGSKTFRERDLASSDALTFLEVGVPFLAGTYDERMYEELRLRAQTFEVLTGGDLATDKVEVDGSDEKTCANGDSEDLNLVLLPDRMVSDLRVKLDVWEEEAETKGQNHA